MTSNFDITHDCTSLATADITAILHLVFPDKAIAMTADNNNVSQNIVDLVICPWCKSQPTSMERQGEKNNSSQYIYSCSSLYCYKCHAHWYLCSDCSVNEIYPLCHGKGGSGRTACHRRKKKFMEHVQWHREKASISRDVSTDNMSCDDINLELNEFVVDDDADSSNIITDDNSTGIIDDSVHNIRSVFDNAESCHIGEFMIHELAGHASRHIIQESVMGSSLFSTSKEISTNDSLLFMLLFSIGTRMSREERNKLATMISLIQNKVEEETLIAHGMLSASHVRIPLPVASYDMRKIFESGKQQFTNYMPVPAITSPIPGYASISLPKTLQIMYSRGHNWDNKYLFQTSLSHETDMLRSILKGDIAIQVMSSVMGKITEMTEQESTVLQPIVAWSDLADLNKVKNNRASIKVHNIYIPHKDGQSPHCVFPLGIGSGRSAHDTYRSRMFSEIDEMHEGPITCYDRSTRQVTYVRFFLLAVVQDRPEHSEFTGTIGHNGKYGALPGYSFPRSICVGSFPGVHVLKNLVSCQECYTRRLNSLTGREDILPSNNIPCNNCYDWDITRVQFRRPQKMPKDIPDNCYVNNDKNTNLMTSKLITFETIKTCLQYIHDKAYTKQWTHYSNTVQSYASLECVSGALAKQVYEYAKSLRKLHIQQEGTAEKI
jgi:hypothetical protein